MRFPLLAASLALALPAAAQEAGDALAAAPAGWLGATPHLVMVGTLAGHPIDLRYRDVGAAFGIAAFSGKREYLPGEGGAWRYGDFEVVLQAVIDGVERSFEVEVENRDFAAHPLPATFALGGENSPEGLNAFLEMSAEWETEAGSVNEELGGWTGTLTLARDDGTPDGRGLLPDGLIGGHMVAERGGDRLAMSWTVPVAGYELDD